jgi:hypothetical protein
MKVKSECLECFSYILAHETLERICCHFSNILDIVTKVLANPQNQQNENIFLFPSKIYHLNFFPILHEFFLIFYQNL